MAGSRRRITEHLDIDLEREMWVCNRCEGDLISARENYKKGCLLYARDPREIHAPLTDSGPYTFAYDPEWTQLVEIYCPHCGQMIENEYLPPGHPLTYDIEIDLDTLKAKAAAEAES